MVLSIFTSRARRAGQRIVNNLNLHEVMDSERCLVSQF